MECGGMASPVGEVLLALIPAAGIAFGERAEACVQTMHVCSGHLEQHAAAGLSPCEKREARSTF
jgi:hypothetical protein